MLTGDMKTLLVAIYVYLLQAEGVPPTPRYLKLELGWTMNRVNAAKDALRNKGYLRFPTGKFDRMQLTKKGKEWLMPQ